MKPGLIVNADDLGVDSATTCGILSAYQNGIVSSASLMVTMPAAEDAVTTAQPMGMPVGLHLALTQGRAIAAHRVDRLVDETGYFKLRAKDLIRLRRKDTLLIEQIRIEIRAQLTRAREFGLLMTHVDSHQHVHMNPVIFTILEQEASTFGIANIRFSREPLRFLRCSGPYLQVIRRNNLWKWLVTRAYAGQIRPRLQRPDLFFGNFYSGLVTKSVLLNVLSMIPTNKSVELCIHPGLPGESGRRPTSNFEAFSTSTFRRLEHDALVDAEVIDLVRKRGLTLRSFDGTAKRR